MSTAVGEARPALAGTLPRVVFLIDELEVGGAQRQILLLGRALRERGHPVTVAYFRRSTAALAQEFAGSGFQVELIEKRRRIDPVFFAGLARFLARERRSLLISVGFTSNLWTRLAGMGVRGLKLVCCVRDHTYLPEVAGSGLLRGLEWCLSFRSLRVVPNSPEAALSLARRGCVPRGKLHVIENAIEIEEIASREEAREALRQVLGELPEGPVIGTLARLTPVKDLPTLLRAAARVIQKRPEAVFVVGGEGPERGRLEALRDEVGLRRSVRFPGTLPGRRVVAAFDAAVLTSLQEGMPNFLLEAMAAGVPVVSTRVGSIPGLLQGGRLGRMAPPGDPAALADALLETIERPAEARARADLAAGKVRGMTSSLMADRYLSLFHEERRKPGDGEAIVP